MGPLTWLIIAGLLLLSAFFSSIETALFSISQLSLERIRRKDPQKGRWIASLLKDPSRMVNLIITGNTLVNVAFSVIWTGWFILAFGDRSVIWAVISGTVMLLLLGELLPKAFAISYAEAWVYVGCGFLRIISWILLPVSQLVGRILKLLFGIFGLKFGKVEMGLNEEELDALLELGEKRGLLQEIEAQMLKEAMELDERTVDEIMTPRVDIVGVDILSSLDDIRKLLRSKKFSKLPVYKGSVDYILGYIRTSEVLLHPEKDWRTFMRKALMVPETKTLSDLLDDFRQMDEELSIVIDEYGGTAGLVTLEDVVEEIMGNISDEFDKDFDQIMRRSDGAYIVSGMTSLRNLQDELGLDLEVEEVDTVGGFVLHKLGYVPKGGERFMYKGWVWEIDKVRGNRIEQVVVKAG